MYMHSAIEGSKSAERSVAEEYRAALKRLVEPYEGVEPETLAAPRQPKLTEESQQPDGVLEQLRSEADIKNEAVATLLTENVPAGTEVKMLGTKVTFDHTSLVPRLEVIEHWGDDLELLKNQAAEKGGFVVEVTQSLNTISSPDPQKSLRKEVVGYAILPEEFKGKPGADVFSEGLSVTEKTGFFRKTSESQFYVIAIKPVAESETDEETAEGNPEDTPLAA